MCLFSLAFFVGRIQHAKLVKHAGRAVVLAIRNPRFSDQVRLVVNGWEAIEKATRTKSPPFILRFTSRSPSPQQLRL